MNIILLGCGGVGCTFLEFLNVTPIGIKLFKKINNIIVLDMEDKSNEPTIRNLKSKIQFVKVTITKTNLSSELDKYTHSGDILVDLSYNIYFKPLIKYCLSKNIMYINTSMEQWHDENEYDVESNFKQRTLHEMHKEALSLNQKHGATQLLTHGRGATQLLTHGMNPGLISHFAYLGIQKVTEKILRKAKKNKIKNTSVQKLKEAYDANNFPKMSYLLGIKVFQCAEIDTQKSNYKRKSGEFVNTWGAYSFYAEAVDPAQISYGTHENKFKLVKNMRDENQIILHKRGMDVQLSSHSHNSDIIGKSIPHSENDTLCKSLKYRDYYPSSYYVYHACQDAINSLDEVRLNKYKMLPKQKVLRANEIISGEDSIGSVLIFENDPIKRILYNKITKSKAFWSGTILNIEQTKALGFKYSGPTTVQVGASLCAAIKWMMKNKNKGVIFPEDVPYKYILKHSKKYLGTIMTKFINYKPDIQLSSFVA